MIKNSFSGTDDAAALRPAGTLLRDIQSSDCSHTSRLASGYRINTTGALNNVGAQGLCWSSSPASGGANAGGLNFNSTYVGPVPDHNRANAFPVRCVQHLRLF